MSKDNQQISYKNNQFKNDVSLSVYQEICNKNLKLLKLLDKVNNENLGLTERIEYLTNLLNNLDNENLNLKENVKFLNNSLDNLDLDLNNLEVNFKALNKPLIIDLELTNFSIPILSLLALLFISLLKNFLTLKNDDKELKLSLQGNK